MEYQLVAQGTVLDSFDRLGAYDSAFAEGERGELRLELRSPLPIDVVTRLDREARNRGVELWDEIRQSGNVLYIRGVQGVPWLPIIAFVLGAIAIIALVLIVRWAIYKVAGPVRTEGSNAAFVGGLALPLVAMGFGPAEPQKRKATLLASLMVTGYVTHALGSHGRLPDMFQELYDQLLGRPPTPPGDGEPPAPPPPPGPPTPPALETRIQDVHFWSDQAAAEGKCLRVYDGVVIRPQVNFQYWGPPRGASDPLYVHVGIAPSALFGHHAPYAWLQTMITDLGGTGQWEWITTIVCPDPFRGVTWPPPLLATAPGPLPKAMDNITGHGDLDVLVEIGEPGYTQPDSRKRVLFTRWFDPCYRYVDLSLVRSSQ